MLLGYISGVVLIKYFRTANPAAKINKRRIKRISNKMIIFFRLPGFFLFFLPFESSISFGILFDTMFTSYLFSNRTKSLVQISNNIFNIFKTNCQSY